MIRARATVVEANASALVLEVPGWAGQRPGQFAMLSLEPDGLSRDPLLPRPMAVFRSERERVEFRYEVVGRGTALLARLAPGEAVGVVGPLGNGFPEFDRAPVLVGGGTGIASLFELAAGHPGCRVLLGGRTSAHILGLHEFEKLGVDLGLATDDGSLGHHGLVTDLLEPDAGADALVVACGPTPMMQAVYARAHKAGARCWVSLENQMACGYGVCLGCVIPTEDGLRLLCTHGPVFEAGTVRWDELP